ncbi:hypothetical protein B0H13DRAFT_2571157 [Mycena leptocephala]|nr:hypothetical protein B0H13DRAFT_2571157 [Mycena leptocephala]
MAEGRALRGFYWKKSSSQLMAPAFIVSKDLPALAECLAATNYSNGVCPIMYYPVRNDYMTWALLQFALTNLRSLAFHPSSTSCSGPSLPCPTAPTFRIPLVADRQQLFSQMAGFGRANSRAIEGRTGASLPDFVIHRSMGLLDDTSDPQNLRLPSVGSLCTPPCVPSSNEEAEHNRHTVHRSSSYECAVCRESFTRPSDLRTHQNTHTGKEPFACDFPGCLKKFGIRSNLLRHQSAAHGIVRTGRARPIAPYKVEFRPRLRGPPLLSDTAPMRAGILWDNEGPSTRRPIDWPQLRSVARHPANEKKPPVKIE